MRSEGEFDGLLRTAQRVSSLAAADDYKGWDPYDGLESPLFKSTPLYKLKLPRLLLIQLHKRLPLNLRPLFLIKKMRNPKAASLFVSGLVNLHKVSGAQPYEGEARQLLDWLRESQSDGRWSGGWGYCFDWQSRAFFAPKGTPNAVCTVFAASSFLDCYECFGDDQYLEVALRACDFITEHLNRTGTAEGICFSYTPLDWERVHNANLLVSSLLARVGSQIGERAFADVAGRAVDFSLSRQSPDGSWYYGEAPYQRWVDSFHTGYNLASIHSFINYTGRTGLENSLVRGFDYYKRTFFTQDSIPKFHPHRVYPLDIHNVAQGIVTFVRLRRFEPEWAEIGLRLAKWAVENMYDPKGYFHYQRQRLYCNRIPYLRWAQAWMFYALSVLLEALRSEGLD